MKTLFFILLALPLAAQRPDGRRVILYESTFELQASKEQLLSAIAERAKIVNHESITGKYHVDLHRDTRFFHTITAEIKDNRARLTISADSSDKKWDAVDYFYPKNGAINKISVKWLVILKGEAEKIGHEIQQTAGRSL